MNLLFALWGSAIGFNKNNLGSAQKQWRLLAVRKYLLIKRETHRGNPDLSQLAALENLPFKMFDKIGKSIELAKEDCIFWVRIASKIGLTCTRTGHSPFLPQSGLHSQASSCPSVPDRSGLMEKIKAKLSPITFERLLPPPTRNTLPDVTGGC